jgi:hypothetical protein
MSITDITIATEIGSKNARLIGMRDDNRYSNGSQKEPAGAGRGGKS